MESTKKTDADFENKIKRKEKDNQERKEGKEREGKKKKKVKEQKRKSFFFASFRRKEREKCEGKREIE